MDRTKTIVKMLSIWFIVIGIIYVGIWYIPWVYSNQQEASLKSEREVVYKERSTNQLSGKWDRNEELTKRLNDIYEKRQKYSEIVDYRKYNNTHSILSVMFLLLGIIGVTIYKKL